MSVSRDPLSLVELGPLGRLAMWLLSIPGPRERDAFAEGDPHVQTFHASPRYFKYLVTIQLLVQGFMVVVFGSIIAVLVVALVKKPPPPGARAVLLAVLGILVFAYLFQLAINLLSLRIEYELRWYRLSSRALRIREGSWIVREMTMTFANVQNVSIEQGPLQRYFGISDVKVVSAGGGGSIKGSSEAAFDMHTAYFRGIEEPEVLRDLVYERQRQSRDAAKQAGAGADTGLGDPDEGALVASESADLTGAVAALREEARGLRQAAEQLVTAR
ncbi:MAG: PH domain-containing protein [Polyangiaceae bacterium]